MSTSIVPSWNWEPLRRARPAPSSPGRVRRTALRPRYSAGSAWRPCSTRSWVSVRAKVWGAGMFGSDARAGKAVSCDAARRATAQTVRFRRIMRRTIRLRKVREQDSCDEAAEDWDELSRRSLRHVVSEDVVAIVRGIMAFDAALGIVLLRRLVAGVGGPEGVGGGIELERAVAPSVAVGESL